MAQTVQRTVLVTGGNRGLGLETVRQLAQQGHRVALASRDPDAGEFEAERLRSRGLDVTAFALDLTAPASVRTLHGAVLDHFGHLDVLVNNAAVYLDEGESVLSVPPEVFETTWQANFQGPLRLCQAFVPGMRERRYGRVVNLSSGAGQLSSMGDFAPSYSVSKAALNALTRMVADAAKGRNVLVNSLDPGWVRTRMGGDRAPRSVEQGADTIVWLATLPDGGPSGGFYRDRKPIPW